MKSLTNYLKTNLINIIGTIVLVIVFISIVLCFVGAAFSGNSLIAHPVY